MPFVKIHREKQFADYGRAYEIYVDDIKKGEIRAGSTEDFFVADGAHRIRLKIDWCGSNEIEFNLRAEETIEFDCGNNTKLFFALYYVLIAPSEYLWLRKR